MEAYSLLLTRRHTSAAIPQVFLVPGQDGWCLPAFVPDKDIYNTDVVAANRVAQTLLGIPVVTRQALRLMEPVLGRPLNIYAIEVRHDCPNPSPTMAGTWFGRDLLQEFSFAVPKERAVLAAWFAEAYGDNGPSLNIPWWQEGWFETTSGWLQTSVQELGKLVIAPVEQVRSAYTSAILRVLTDDGYVYLKVVPPALAHEIPLTQMLAQYDGDHIPVILTATRDRMLLRDFGNHRPLGHNVSLARWEEILRFYGRLQVSSANSVSRWFAAGCQDLRTDSLANRLEEILAQVPERLYGLPQQLSVAESTRLGTLAVPLRTLCEELASYGLPDVLDHGDLHAGNVALYETGFRIYDWSHACITHPFYGFGSLFFDDDWFPEQPDAISRLRDTYLEAWTPWASLPRLRDAMDLWKRLRPLYVAVHQSATVAAYQGMLGSNAYIPETASGNALQYMQWWLASHWRNVLQSIEAR